MSKKRIRCTILLSLSLFLLLCTAPTDAFKYTGYGANRTVSGSMHLLEIGNKNILLDAGSFYDREGEEEGRYDGEFIASLSAIIISHAHTDHLGNLSKIVNMGYEGKIYCTEPTAALMPVMLEMASKYGYYGLESFYYSQANEGRYQNIAVHIYSDCQYGSRISPRNFRRIKLTRDKLARENFYLCNECIQMEVDKTMQKVVAVPANEPFAPTEGIIAEFLLTPHIPGSAMIKLTELATQKTLLYSGDLGSGLSPFLPPQQYPRGIDYLIFEATYGAGVKPIDPCARIIFQALIGSYIREGKRVIIPAFVLDRTQQVLFELTKGIQKGLIPETPIWVIGYSVAKLNRIYKEHFTREEYVQYFSDQYQEKGPFGSVFTERGSLGKEQIRHGEIAIVSTGMADASWAHEFVKEWHQDPNTVFAFVGYQAPNTPGAQLTTTGELTIEGVTQKAKALVVKFDCFSSHANFQQISELIEKAGDVEEALIVHLNSYDCDAVSQAYREKFPSIKFHIPSINEEYTFGE